MDCPDPARWAELISSGMPDENLNVHAESCAECRRVLRTCLAALEAPLPEFPPGLRERILASPPKLHWHIPALAAALLVSVSLIWWKRGREEASPSRVPVQALSQAPEARLPSPGILAASDRLQEWMLGPTAEAALAPGSKGLLEPSGRFRLEEGQAWVESSNDRILVSVAGWDGTLEFSDGAVALQSRPKRVSFLMRDAWAGEEAWGITVVRGSARAGDRILSAGESLGSGAPRADFRGWRSLPKAEGRLKDSVRVLLPEAPGAYAVELLVRKRLPTAEGALLFRHGGKGWEVLLGKMLTSGGWVRLRLEVSPGRVRLLAGERERFSRRPEDLGAVLPPAESASALALRAWGGDLEITEARWRP